MLAVAVVFRHAGVVLATLVSLVGSYAAVILGIGWLAIFLSRRSTHGTPPTWARRLRLTGGRWRTIETALMKLRATIDSVEKVDVRPAVFAFLASVVHVGIRLFVLPAPPSPTRSRCCSRTAGLDPCSTTGCTGSPLVTAFLGLVTMGSFGPGADADGCALGNAIPARLFAAALIWWRFYTFYIYILLGALAAGNTVMRAVRKTEEYESEVEMQSS